MDTEKREVNQKFEDFKDYITDIRKESNSKQFSQELDKLKENNAEILQE